MAQPEEALADLARGLEALPQLTAAVVTQGGAVGPGRQEALKALPQLAVLGLGPEKAVPLRWEEWE